MNRKRLHRKDPLPGETASASEPALLDAHAHLPFDPAEAAEWFVSCPYRVRLNTTGPDEWSGLEELYALHPDRIEPYFGIHPWFVRSIFETGSADDECRALKRLEHLLLQHPAAGVGEIGLDKLPRNRATLVTQQRLFGAQLELAHRLRRPVSIHCVHAWGPVLEILRSYAPGSLPFQIHFFNGSYESFREIRQLGGSVSFAPPLLKPANTKMRAVFSRIPQEDRLFESDLPLSKKAAEALKQLNREMDD